MKVLSAAGMGGSSRAAYESSYFILRAGMSFGGRPISILGPLSNAVFLISQNF